MNICLCLPLSICYCLELFQMSVTSYLQKPFSQFLYCLGTCHGFSHSVGALSVFKPKTRLTEGTQLAVMKHRHDWKVWFEKCFRFKFVKYISFLSLN